jgi:uncharacterized glyoxalase superfamily protein PhnB
MLIPHLHFSGECYQAMKMYVKAFEILKDEQKVIIPMKATDFTSCTVGFWDKYGIRWGFMVQ